ARSRTSGENGLLGFRPIPLSRAMLPISQSGEPPSNPGRFIFSSTFMWSAQSFKPSADNISGAGFFLSNSGLNAVVTATTINLWTGNPSAGGVKLAGGTANITTSPHPFSGNWFDVFWSPVAVTSGQTYWLTVGGSPAQTAYALLTVSGGGNAYAKGDAWYNLSLSETDGYAPIFGGVADFAFRTYATTTVPEPSTFALVLAGVGAVGLAAKRRRRDAT
ncbi:MAG: PEP-CTERM sorting domain-containing protein, partial [Gemmatimonadaceae bacterium]|nr:PEP-CTERM sorting domain-containing protein [Gemmatimonadaceae bacterium]